MTDKEIEAIFAEKIAILKQYWNNKPLRALQENDLLKSYDFYKEREKIPPLNPIYRRSVEYRDMIRVHSDIDNKPIDLMRKRAPNEDDRQFLYRVRNFENITMASFMKALSKLSRIFNPSNYSVQWDQSQEEEKAYFESGIPIFGSLLTYFAEIVTTDKILDPNALAIARPYYIPTKEALDEKGRLILVINDQEPITPICCIVGCEKVIAYKEDVFALILTDEKSKVLVGGKPKEEGLVFEFYDRENIYRISQEGNKSDWKFTDPEIYYPHNLGYLPAWKLKGIPIQKDMHVLYQSYFIYALPNLNEALYLNSSLYMSMVTHMHPHLVEWVDRCYAEGCDRGIVREYGENNVLTTRACASCKGTGRLSNVGPMMTKQFVIPDQTQGDTDINAVPFPGMEYVEPNVEASKFVDSKILKLIVDAWMYINIETSNSEVKGSDTALGKQIDREELFAMLLRISDELFWLFAKMQKAMGQMRFGMEFKEPVVSAPTSFSIRSEKDLLEELTEAKTAGVPDVALTEIVKEYIAKRYSNRANIHKIINLAFSIDRLIVKIQIETDSMLASGTASKLEVVLHDSIFTYIDQIQIEDPAFWDKDLKAQSELLWKMAEETQAKIDQAKDLEDAKVIDRITQIGTNANAA